MNAIYECMILLCKRLIICGFLLLFKINVSDSIIIVSKPNCYIFGFVLYIADVYFWKYKVDVLRIQTNNVSTNN